jgi:peptidyl-prolyl cis-trans isomerase B (cyclophilin B)
MGEAFLSDADPAAPIITTGGSMAGRKRERELARAKAARQAERRDTQQARHRRIQQILGVAVALAVVMGAVVWFALGRSADTTADEPLPMPTEPLAPDVEPTAQPTPQPTDPEPTSTVQPVAGCTTPPEPRGDDLSFPQGPEQVIDNGEEYSITLGTNCGDITVATFPEKAPQTVNSMVFLTEQGYFDLTRCHRLTTEGIYVLQCGDPAGNGTGGPGYVVPDENLPPGAADNYPAGTVAMANAGAGTSGSQFFIVYANSTLPAAYTIWGEVTEGLDIVTAIADAGVAGGGVDGPPAQRVVIEQATVGR